MTSIIIRGGSPPRSLENRGLDAVVRPSPFGLYLPGTYAHAEAEQVQVPDLLAQHPKFEVAWVHEAKVRLAPHPTPPRLPFPLPHHPQRFPLATLGRRCQLPSSPFVLYAGRASALRPPALCGVLPPR